MGYFFSKVVSFCKHCLKIIISKNERVGRGYRIHACGTVCSNCKANILLEKVLRNRIVWQGLGETHSPIDVNLLWNYGINIVGKREKNFKL